MVVVKGIGIISPLGRGKQANLTGLKKGETSIKKVPTPIGDMLMARVEDFLLPREFNSMPRPVQFGYIAVKEAVEEAGLSKEDLSSPETAFLFSSSKGDLSYLGKKVDKDFWQNFLPHGVTTHLAKLFNLRGPRLSIVSACATGITVMARALELLLDKKIKRVIVGAAEAPLLPLLLVGYDKMGVLSHSEMRPFDRYRDGFVLGEGAVSLVLEKEGKGIGTISGCSLASGGNPYRFDLDADALAHCLRELTIKKNSLPDYINTHGTATIFGDMYESIQIKKAFGKDAYKIPVSSIKSMTGHLLGVSGLLEFALTLLCLKDGFIPAVCGLKERDPDCDLNYVMNNISGNFRKFLIVSYGFGGPIACVSGEVWV
jgi:3-oxoacyl-[acyl-carrier-protein] synthase II